MTGLQVADDAAQRTGWQHLMKSFVPAFGHRPVLVEEVLDFLRPRPGAVIVDATAGAGGHSLAIVPKLLPDGRLILIDRDRDTLAQASARLTEFAPLVTSLHGNFRDLPQLLAQAGCEAVDGILLDLGVSSMQLDAPARGFSFQHEGPLDMRMDRGEAVTAETIVNTWSAQQLESLLREFGEERFAGRIARQIVAARKQAPVTTTSALARLVVSALPASARHGRIHAATRTFQALRIAVNAELEALSECVRSLGQSLRSGGRAVIISFHSLEDRVVKRAFLEGQREGMWTILTKKPVTASDAEMAGNPRSRSAKLRAMERNA